MARKPIKMLRMSQTEEATGLGRSTITGLENQGLFPTRVRLTKNTFGYVAEEVQVWLEGRVVLRDINNPELLKSDKILNADLTRKGAAA